MGMVTENFQFNRDKYYLATRPTVIASSIPYFVGRPEFLLFTDSLSHSSENLIDVKKLILEACRLLELGSESLMIEENYLKTLNLGFMLLQFDVDTMHYFDRLGRTECLDIIEFYFLTVTKWMMNFDEFNYLDRDVKLKVVKTVWFIWCKIHKCVATVRYRKLDKQAKREHKILRYTCIDRKQVKVDTSWLSDYPHVYVSR
ncbi:hypothetical protein CAEBREN_28441 [Caenorhabditis brenneri]|uniref:NR LBD domain-containing protein n=1 Tax=Caenorhabditis brenneri TaxID=135651 RepID=G0M9J9_CAEBE|nr:hypothetical protein CAEBREN_28441 [Caenorhabditis brenneri]